jgi:hypothetical protein
MSWWDKKIPSLAEAVEKERKKSVPKVNSVCIHGDTECIRCAVEDIQNETRVLWESLEQDDVKKVIYSLPESIVTSLRKAEEKAILAGGYIRAIIGSEPVNDIDIFVDSKRTAIGFCGYKDEKDKHYAFEAGGIKVQVIWRYPFTNPGELLEQFDYTAVKAAIWFDNGDSTKKIEPGFKSICHQRFYRDLARKMLVYDCDREVERVESIPRLLKYTRYGYNIDPHSLADVITKTCLSLDLSNGFEGIRKKLEECYTNSGKSSGSRSWKEMTKRNEPPSKSTSYSYGS